MGGVSIDQEGGREVGAWGWGGGLAGGWEVKWEAGTPLVELGNAKFRLNVFGIYWLHIQDLELARRISSFFGKRLFKFLDVQGLSSSIIFLKNNHFVFLLIP